MAEIRFPCPHCGANLHVDEQFVGRLVKCPKCAQTSRAPAPLAEKPDESVVLAEDINPAKKPEAFAVQLTRAFVYPFKGSGIFMLIMATATFVAMTLLSYITCAAPILALFFSFYLWAYYVSIISSSAAGDDELPDWPDADDLWNEIVKPVLLIFAALFASILPLVIYAYISDRGQLFSDVEEITPLTYVLIVWALLYFPMGLLAIAVLNTVVALNPLVIIKAIAKIPLRYLLACVLFFLVFYVNVELGDRFTEIPIIGIVIQIFFSLYMMMAAMRILGLIYYANAKKIGWFEG